MSYLIKSPVASVVFWSTLLEADFATYVPTYVAVSINLLPYLSLNLFANDKKTVSFNVFSVLWFCWISHFYKAYQIITVKFTLSSISSGLLFWSVNHNWTDWNSSLVVFNIVNKCGEIVINWRNCLLGAKVNNALDACWKLLLTRLKQLKTLKQLH